MIFLAFLVALSVAFDYQDAYENQDGNVYDGNYETEEYLDEITALNSDYSEPDIQFDPSVDYLKVQVDVEDDDLELHADPAIATLQKTVKKLTRQLLLTELYVEEMTRSSGQSGVKQTRINGGGSRPYYSPHHSSGTVAAMHDHANHIRTVGIGEFIAVLNGVEFRTRHNDYPLRMPHRSKKDYHATEEVPFPLVPPAVLAKKTVQEQSNEMREWFKAFSRQDIKHRDYRPYFKPILCYLEGAWTTTGENIEPPFGSDRHRVEAATWEEMQEKIRFTSYNGRKNIRENLLFLPNKIIGTVENSTTPIMAQWNYRLLCHPLRNNLPTAVLKPVDDLAPRMARKKNFGTYRRSRFARFKTFGHSTRNDRFEGGTSLLDRLMSEIPGKDNYPGFIRDNAFGLDALNPRIQNNTVLNVARYHRFYRVAQSGAMGRTMRHRAFSDDTVFMALNTRPKIPGSKFTDCVGKGANRRCTTYHQRASYAVPLEIIYLTPLARWNPHNITYKGLAYSKEGRTVTANGRVGRLNKRQAFNGTNSKYFYHTPGTFFHGKPPGSDPADTSRGVVGVLDSAGNLQRVQASGVRMFLPNITGVGIIRTRYPIMPIHGEGSGVWKELEALKDMVMESHRYNFLFRERMHRPTPGATTAPDCWIRLQTSISRGENVEPHMHDVYINNDDDLQLRRGLRITKTSTIDNGHSHEFELSWTQVGGYKFAHCDGFPVCWDDHEPELHIAQNTC